MNWALPYKEVIKCCPSEPQKRVVCVRTGAVEPFWGRYLCYYDPHISVVYRDVYSYLVLKEEQSQTVIIVSLRELAPMLWEKYYVLDEETVRNQIDSVKDMLKQLVEKAELSCDHPIMFLLGDPLFDYPREDNDRNILTVYRELNTFIDDTVSTTICYSMEKMASQIGTDNFWDSKMLYRTGCPYSFSGCNMLAYYTFKAMNNGHTSKCIICDCDDVLWGGVIADDGYEGIVLSGNNIGRAYRDFQRELTRLVNEGYILCLCSKASPEDLQTVFKNHPDMILREKDIASMRLGCSNKAEAILSMSKELNIMPDEMVFIDDSEYEIGLVKEIIPEIKCLCLDRNRPYSYVSAIREENCLKKSVITEADQNRAKMYLEDKVRKELYQRETDIESYNLSLNTRLDIHLSTQFDLYRIAQLSQRTHQCNLSDSHLSLNTLKDLSNDSNYSILSMYASDIYGNMGLVGALVMHVSGQTSCIDHFWLSCRVFGRKFEFALLNKAKDISSEKGCRSITAVYRTTEKNRAFSDFYSNNGILSHE